MALMSVSRPSLWLQIGVEDFRKGLGVFWSLSHYWGESQVIRTAAQVQSCPDTPAPQPHQQTEQTD